MSKSRFALSFDRVWGDYRTLIVTLFGFSLVVGRIGNSPPRSLVLGGTWGTISVTGSDYGPLLLEVWPRLNPLKWSWNSEWIAFRYGEGPSEEEFMSNGIEYSQYNGILGFHQYV